MEELARARPSLTKLDLRGTSSTYDLIVAFLKGLGPATNRSSEIIKIKVDRSDLSAKQKHKLDITHPHIALINYDNELDLSESSLDLSQVRLKLQHLPSVTNVNLSESTHVLCPFSILHLEEEECVDITQTPPMTLKVPKISKIGTLEKITTVADIEAVLERYNEIKEVDLTEVEGLEPTDIIYLEETYRETTFNSPSFDTCSLPLADSWVIERLCLRFGKISIQVDARTVADEKVVYDLLPFFPDVTISCPRRISHMLEDHDLLSTALKKSLQVAQNTQLTRQELEDLAKKRPDIKPVISRIIAYRTKPRSESVLGIIRAIELIEKKESPKTSPTEPCILSRSLGLLLKKHSDRESNRWLFEIINYCYAPR